MEPWNAVFLAGLIAYLTIRHVFGRHTRGNEKAVRRADATDWTLLIIVMAGSLLLPVLYLATPWFAFADYRLPAVAPWCGTVLMGAALWLFWRSHADLGMNWSVTLELRQGHQLVTQGVYRSIRHPMYASTWLWCLAQGLVLQNWLAGWAALVAFALLYFVRTPREEQMMCEFFGQEYRDYIRQTGRLFPRRSRSGCKRELSWAGSLSLGLRGMVRFTASIKNQSLSISFVLLVLCFPMVGYLSAPLSRWHEASFLLRTGLIVFCLFALWCIALIILVKDADRGYSPSRCSLAAVILLLAVAPLGFVGYQVLWATAHLK